MVEFNKNIWAPWRMEYIDQLSDDNSTGCFLCYARDNPDQDAQTFTLVRGEKAFAIMNRFPYTSGHLLIAPYWHTGRLCDLDDATMLELMCLVRDMEGVLSKVLRAEGFNVGLNLSRCAGAGLPDHLHIHLVPRWGGDTNFMSVIGDVRVIPEAMAGLYERLREAVDGGQGRA